MVLSLDDIAAVAREEDTVTRDNERVSFDFALRI